MPSQSGLQQLVEAAGGIAAENKENASRKRGRDFVELIAPAPKQVCQSAWRKHVVPQKTTCIQMASFCQLVQYDLQMWQRYPPAWHLVV